MTGLAISERNKRFYFNWVTDIFLRPRLAFQRIANLSSAVWITPLLILTCLVLANTLISGRIKNQATMSGEITYPPDYQYYTPEQQAQYMQAIQSTQGPVFVYVLPAIAALLGVWVGWLILGGILHLVTTLLGGRGSTMMSMNIVAWASLPLALRALVQIVYMLAMHKIIASPGLSGFSPAGDSGFVLFIGYLLELLDIYIVWQIILLIIGINISTALSFSKSVIGVTLVYVLILALQAGISYAISLLGNLSITRPFFF